MPRISQSAANSASSDKIANPQKINLTAYAVGTTLDLYVTIINKTLPRLIELGRHARIVLVGPSVPLSPFWFEKGISSLAGTTVTDAAKIWRHVAEGGDKSIFKEGAHMFKLSPKDVR